MHALDVETGEVAWYTPAPDVCAELRGCMRAFSSAPTSIDGAVFTGGLDGRIRAYASTDGALLWEFDAARDFDTVNGVLAKGGAFDGPGPVVDDGMLF
nr:dehydrogenase [Gemmatimonadota bacterium]NIU77882.1 dehydrogenase [Gammaproteobacteria bacterium]